MERRRNDSYVNGILYLAQLKMGLSSIDSRPDQYSILVKLGNQQCILTHEELKTKKLNVPRSMNNNLDVDFKDCKKSENSNDEQPLDLSLKKETRSSVKTQELRRRSMDQMKNENCKYEDATTNSLSNQSETPDNTSDKQVTSEQYFASTESNDSSYVSEKVSDTSGSSKELDEKMGVVPGTSQTSTRENGTVDNSSQVEEEKEDYTSRVNLESNQKHHSNDSVQNYYSPRRRICCFCQELVFHNIWNCPKRREDRNRNKFSPYAPSSSHTNWRPHYKPYPRLWQRNDHFNNASMNFNQKNNVPAKRGTFRRVYQMLQSSNQGETRNWPQKTKKKSPKTSTETANHHKVLFKGEWYINRIAADAESYLNKKEEVSQQIKKEHRELDEGFEDIQQVLSDDENPNENPTFVYTQFQKHFKDEDNDPGGSSASFSTAA